MRETVRISLVSQLMKMTPDAIRFYEKKKILNPSRSRNSKYREYSVEDIRKLYDCKNLRNFDFTIKEVEYIMNTASKKECIQMLEDKKRSIEQNILEQSMLLKKLTNSIEAHKIHENWQEKHYGKQGIEYVFYPYSIDGILNDDLILSPIYERVMSFPNLFSCATNFQVDTAGAAKADIGFAIEKSIAMNHGIPTDFPAQIISIETSVSTVMMTRSIISFEDVRPIVEWANESGFVLGNFIFSRLLNTIYDSGEEQRFYEVFSPIQPEAT